MVHALGGDWNEIYCRGQILDYKLDNGLLIINTETAWGEMSDVRHFIQFKYPSLQIFFQTEECGMCIFQTNDHTGEYFPEKWLLDWNDEAENLYLWEYFRDLPAVIEYLKGNGIITKDIQPTKEAILAVLDEIQNSRPDDVSFSLGEFVVVDD